MDLVLRRLVLTALVAGSVLLGGCSGTGEAVGRSEAPPAVEGSEAPPDVRHATVAADPVEVRLPVEARLVTETEVAVVARITGLLEEVLVERGDEVTEGQALARFENRIQELAWRSAEAELARARAEEERLRSVLDAGLISRQEYDRALRDRDVAQAERDLAEHLLERTEVRAPFAGVVTVKAARPGMYIQEEDTVLLFRLVGDGPLQARVYLPEWTAGYLRVGDPVDVVPVYGGGEALSGRVRWISPFVDPVAGTVEARVHLAANAAIAMGSSVTLNFRMRSGPTSVAVPRDCLVEVEPAAGSEATVLVLGSEGEWERRTVRLGLVGPERVEVQRGIEAGERVLAAPPRG